jgi:hypothetical protein
VGAWNPGLGPSGLTLRDWSPYKNHGTLTNMPSADGWKINQRRHVLDFDGTNDLVLSSQNVAVTGSTPRSVSCWVFLTSVATANYSIFGWGVSTASQWFYVLIIAGRWYVSGLNNDFDTGVSASIGWQHIVVSYNGTTAFVYVDGKNIGSLNMSLTTGAGLAYIGSRQAFAAIPLSGQLDSIAVHNRALSPNEIRLLASRRGIAYEMAPRNWSAQQIAAYRARYYSQVVGGGVI